jgi:replicative DNA helicase
LDDGVKPPLELQKELGKLSRIGHGESDLGQFYYKGRVSRLSFEDQDDNFYPMGIGIPAIDNYMEGGIQPGEILGIFGAYNTFKSGFFVNVAAYQFAMQRNGVVYSLEMPEKRYSARVDARLTQYTLSELKRGGRFGTLALRALDKFRGTQADIMVKSFPTRKATLSMIRAHIEALSEAQGFVPEYVIIDYLALLKSESPDKKDYLQLAELIYDFRGMAGEFGFRGFTGGQLGRTDGRDARSDGTKVAGSIEMMNAPDVGILIQQTEEQKRNGEIDLKMERCRNSASGAIFRTTVHTDTMTLGMDAFEVLPDGTPVVKNNSMDHS